MDFFQSHKLCPSCYLTFFHIPERSIGSKTTGWFTKRAEIDPNLPHANKVLPGSTRILIYIDGLLSVAPTSQAVAILPSSIFLNVQLH
jgi:hypothetical protein